MNVVKWRCDPELFQLLGILHHWPKQSSYPHGACIVWGETGDE